MPIPISHSRQLKKDLKIHGKRLLKLKELRKSMEEEITVHETLISLGRNPNVIAALNELYDHPELAHKVVAQPATYLNEMGFSIPNDTIIMAVASDNTTALLEIYFKQGRFEYKVIIDKHKGLVLFPLTDYH